MDKEIKATPQQNNAVGGQLERGVRQHTPGPWRYGEDNGDRYCNDMKHGVIAECNDLWVAACYRSGTATEDERSPEAEAEAQANARLIAAAPDLLAALQELRYACTDKAEAMADAAIAKALNVPPNA